MPISKIAEDVLRFNTNDSYMTRLKKINQAGTKPIPFIKPIWSEPGLFKRRLNWMIGNSDEVLPP